MQVLRYIRENPVVLLCVLLTGMIAWVAVDLARPAPKKSRLPDSAFADLPEQTNEPDAIRAEVRRPIRGQVPVSVEVLPMLKRGMTRVEVESLIGAPAADHVHPVTASEGRMTYRIAYEFDDIGPPSTIRPAVVPSRFLPARTSEPGTMIALEFDATRPGHPLVEVLYPDPLF
jgi:hypothetical protein